MSKAQAPALDMNKLNAFIGQFVTDLGASVHAGMVVIGEKLGLYKALAAGPMNPAELAAKTGTDERYLREWLASQAAGGYITYDDAFSTYLRVWYSDWDRGLGGTFQWSLDADYDGHSQDLLDAMYNASLGKQ